MKVWKHLVYSFEVFAGANKHRNKIHTYYDILYWKNKLHYIPGKVLNFELGTDVWPEVSTTTL